MISSRFIGTPLTLMVGLLASLFSCSLITGVDDDEYRIRVDSVTIPEQFSATDTLQIVVHGAVGSDGCYRFDRIASTRTTNAIELTVWGLHRRGNVSCTQMPVYMHEPVAVVPPFTRPFVLIVHQPDGSWLEYQILK